jgi:hypothetical protein
MPEQKQKKPRVDPISQSESAGMSFLQNMITMKLCEPFLEELKEKEVDVCMPIFEISLLPPPPEPPGYCSPNIRMCDPAWHAELCDPLTCVPSYIFKVYINYPASLQNHFFVDFIQQQGKDIESMKESVSQIKDEIAEIKKRIK